MNFTRTALTVFCLSLGVATGASAARADNPCTIQNPNAEQQKACEEYRNSALETLRGFSSVVRKVRIKTDRGVINATWRLDTADPKDAVLEIDTTTSGDLGSVREAIRETVVDAGGTEMQAQQMMEHMHAAPTGPNPNEVAAQAEQLVQETRARERMAAKQACIAGLGHWNDLESDNSKACVSIEGGAGGQNIVQNGTQNVVTSGHGAHTVVNNNQGGSQTELTAEQRAAAEAEAEKARMAAAAAAEAEAEKQRQAAAAAAEAEAERQRQAAAAAAEAEAEKQRMAAETARRNELFSRFQSVSTELLALREAETKKPGGGDRELIGRIDASLAELNTNAVSLGATINQATNVTGQVAGNAAGQRGLATGQQGQQGQQGQGQQNQPAEEQPNEQGWCSVDGGKTKLGATANGTIVESADGGRTTLHSYGGMVDGKTVDLETLSKSYQDARQRGGGLAAADAQGRKDLEKVRWLGLTYVVGGVHVGVKKVSCGFMKYVWEKGLKRAGSALGNQFKKGKPVHKIVHLPVLFFDELIPGKGKRGNFFKNLFVCWPSYPFRKWIYRPIRNAGERAALRERIETGEDDLGDLLVAAQDHGFLTEADIPKYLKEDGSPNYEGIWYDTKEAPRRARGSTCSKPTGENPGHPELAPAINEFYGKNSDRSTPEATVRSAESVMQRAAARRAEILGQKAE